MSPRTAAVLAALTAATTILAGAPHAAAAGPVAAPGMPIYLPPHARCTLGYTASNADGDQLAVTAGHCGSPGAPVRDRAGQIIGTIAAVQPDDTPTAHYGYAIIALRPGVATTAAITATMHLTAAAQADLGDSVCLFGTTTGVHCGVVSTITDHAGVITGFASDHGDSGGPIVRIADHALVGIVMSHDDHRRTYFEPISQVHYLTRATGDGGPGFGPIVDPSGA